MRASIPFFLSLSLTTTARTYYHAPGNFSTDVTSIGHSVANLNKTVSFYPDILGLKILHQDTIPFPNVAYGLLTNTSATTTYLFATLEIPNQAWPLILTQYFPPFSAPPSQQHEQDPAVLASPHTHNQNCDRDQHPSPRREGYSSERRAYPRRDWGGNNKHGIHLPPRWISP